MSFPQPPIRCIGNEAAVRMGGCGWGGPRANDVAECKNTPACAPYKSTFDECVERVTTTIDEKGEANEDCVEECTSPSVPSREGLLLHLPP